VRETTATTKLQTMRPP